MKTSYFCDNIDNTRTIKQFLFWRPAASQYKENSVAAFFLQLKIQIMVQQIANRVRTFYQHTFHEIKHITCS